MNSFPCSCVYISLAVALCFVGQSRDVGSLGFACISDFITHHIFVFYSLFNLVCTCPRVAKSVTGKLFSCERFLRNRE